MRPRSIDGEENDGFANSVNADPPPPQLPRQRWRYFAPADSLLKGLSSRTRFTVMRLLFGPDCSLFTQMVIKQVEAPSPPPPFRFHAHAGRRAPKKRRRCILLIAVTEKVGLLCVSACVCARAIAARRRVRRTFLSHSHSPAAPAPHPRRYSLPPHPQFPSCAFFSPLDVFPTSGNKANPFFFLSFFFYAIT